MERPKLMCLLLAIPFLLFLSCSGEQEKAPIGLTVSESLVELGAEGGTAVLEISSTTVWTVALNSDWITASPIAGEGNARVTLTVVPNGEPSGRSGNARISGSGIVRNVEIRQGAASQLPNDYSIPPDQTGMRPITGLELAREMGRGWNLGNSLEAIGGETAWGNPQVTRHLINSVKAAGFDAVRIPVAWSKFTDHENYTIDPAWMLRVSEVVDYALDAGLYVILNNHWDEGWMQPTYAQQNYVNDRLEKMWLQIALSFRDYDDRLLFAGSNEVMVTGDYGTPTEEYYTVQNGFNQVFIDVVRSTGGRNTYRHLVIQSYNTNIDHAISFSQVPDDDTRDRIMMEVHYYDPWEFALREDDLITQWGEAAKDPSKAVEWGNEAHADLQFLRLKAEYVDKGIPVIVGEFGAVAKGSDPENYGNRTYYYRYLTQSMLKHGLTPFYWDNGYNGNYGFAVVDRNTGEQLHPELIDALTKPE